MLDRSTLASLALALALLSTTACNLYMHGQAGAFKPSSSDIEDSDGFAAEARIGGFDGSDRGMKFGGGGGFRLKWAPELKQFSVSEHLILFPYSEQHLISPYARAGINVLQFESIAGEFGFGMFSPFAEAGLQLKVQEKKNGDRMFISVSAMAEYDVRFTDQSNEGYYTLLVGFGMNGKSRPPPAPGQPPPPR